WTRISRSGCTVRVTTAISTPRTAGLSLVRPAVPCRGFASACATMSSTPSAWKGEPREAALHSRAAHDHRLRCVVPCAPARRLAALAADRDDECLPRRRRRRRSAGGAGQRRVLPAQRRPALASLPHGTLTEALLTGDSLDRATSPRDSRSVPGLLR